MTSWQMHIATHVSTLRRPRSVIEQGKAFFEAYPIRNPADLERVLTEKLGMEIHDWEVDPTTEGCATCGDGKRFILIRPYLNRLRREFALVHETGHHRLHLPGPAHEGIIVKTGGIEDVEADCFLLMYLGYTVQGNILTQMARLFPYIKAQTETPGTLGTPDRTTMIRRVLRVLRYLSWYQTRLVFAALLERLFLSPRR